MKPENGAEILPQLQKCSFPQFRKCSKFSFGISERAKSGERENERATIHLVVIYDWSWTSLLLSSLSHGHVRERDDYTTAWMEIINCKMEVESQFVIEVVKISTSRSRFKHIYANLLIVHKIANRALAECNKLGKITECVFSGI